MISLKNLFKNLVAAVAIFFAAAHASAERVKQISLSENKFEIIVPSESHFAVFALDKPTRLVFDLAGGTIDQIPTAPLPLPFKSVRFSKNKNQQRIVFDLTALTTIESFKTEPSSPHFHKIIVKLAGAAPKEIDKKPVNPVAAKPLPKPEHRLPMIAIDAGHGGKDPGAIGLYQKTHEKNIALAYALALKKQLDETKRYKTYLTRDSDNFISLQNRIQKARRVGAELFISLHANVAADRNASGLSIYTLSDQSSDKQSELLAQKENKADIIYGANFNGASDEIVKVMINLSQRNCMNNSVQFADIAIKLAAQAGVKVINHTHRFAGFVVLTSPDMASALVELGYLSNKAEEEKLKLPSYRKKIVTSLVQAVDNYFKK